MSYISKIEWTETTWNPVTGCSKISDGCQNCYAERLSKRLHSMGNPRYKNGFKITLHRDLLENPLKWKSSRIIFVNSMSDLFHEKVPLSFIKSTFDVMSKANWHVFQVLTKRSKRLVDLADKLHWPENVWMGVTVESYKYAYRIADLAKVPAHVRFLSLEPMLSSISDLALTNIDWVVVGGESGYNSRPIQPEWVRDVRNQCLNASVSFFFKQWGGVNKKKTGRILDGRTWDELPQLSFI